MKFRKKPVVIDAMQYNGSVNEIDEKLDSIKYGTYISVPIKEKDCCYIKTLEGLMKCNIGDYIIRGVKGEFYPCKEEIFNLTYEQVRE